MGRKAILKSLRLNSATIWNWEQDPASNKAFNAILEGRDIAQIEGWNDLHPNTRGHMQREIRTIRPMNPDAWLGSYRGHAPGDFGWKYHEVVVKEGRVYDAFTGHKGMPIEEYKALWQYAEAINFGF